MIKAIRQKQEEVVVSKFITIMKTFGNVLLALVMALAWLIITLWPYIISIAVIWFVWKVW